MSSNGAQPEDDQIGYDENGFIKLSAELRRRSLALCLRRKVTKVPQLASAMLFAMGEVVEGTLDVDRASVIVKMANVALKSVELQERYGPGRGDKALRLAQGNEADNKD